LPVIQESEKLRQTILQAIDYCKLQQEQIENSRSQATSYLCELLLEEPPTNLHQLANPIFEGFVDSISKLDSLEGIGKFQKEMTKAVSEAKQQLQPQFQAQVIQLTGGNK